MAIDVILKGTITLLSPVSISRKGQESQRGVPMITVINEGGPEQLPHIPGETIKGLLRSTSAELVARVSTEKLTLPVYFTLFKGGIKGSDKEKTDDIARTVKFRDSNPVLGLYGTSAPQWLGSSISVGAAVPNKASDTAVHAIDGSRRDDFKLDPERLGMLPPEEVATYLTYVDGVKAKSALEAEEKALKRTWAAAKNSKDPEEKAKLPEISQQLEDIKKRIQALKDEAEVGNTVGRPLDEKFAIAPGSLLTHRLDVIRGREAEVGLLLETLRDLATHCRIGGMRSIGYGFFRADWTIQVRTDPSAQFEPAGEIHLAPESFVLDSDHPAIVSALAAWKARCDEPASLHLNLEDA